VQSVNLAFVVAQAKDERQTEPFALAVRGALVEGSIYVGGAAVLPDTLRQTLVAAGFNGVEDDAALAEYGFASLGTLRRVVITDSSGELVAMGAAGDHDEALLAAALGWFREHPLPDADVPDGIAIARVSPTA
jgi:hypothetical protein